MDAVLRSPGATSDLRSHLRRGFESKPPEFNTEHLDFLQSYRSFDAEADPVAKQAMLTALIASFVQADSPREINLTSAARNRVIDAWNAWDQQGGAEMPVELSVALHKAKQAIDKLMVSRGNPLDLLRNELFPKGDPDAQET